MRRLVTALLLYDGRARLVRQVAAAVAAGWSPHGGLEVTLQQLLHVFVGHGMLFVGLPWTERMRSSGSYYGATASGEVAAHDRGQGRVLGQRGAALTVRLAAS